MRILLFVLLFITTGKAFTQLKDYYVTVNNDTVALSSWDYIDTHSHPQLLWVKQKGKKKVILSDSVVYLQKERTYTTGKFKKVKVMDKFRMVEIPMNNGKTCRHYVRELFRQGDMAIMDTPACNRDSHHDLYLFKDGKFDKTMNSGNFREIINTHFSSCQPLVEYSRKRSYSSGTLVYFIEQKLNCNQ